ncbi:hypothetical protein Y1Q_0008399 [Alligator mississippiensis]|uniref:Uncharacterized protein n=1 Tax=Alligator mississippiensis TaxID=8496 RepID=A0A151MR91_ALLMI|nr:hypothetical protein Y1Q_0008399 [Alligator mississippiensis]
MADPIPLSTQVVRFIPSSYRGIGGEHQLQICSGGRSCPPYACAPATWMPAWAQTGRPKENCPPLRGPHLSPPLEKCTRGGTLHPEDKPRGGHCQHQVNGSQWGWGL